MDEPVVTAPPPPARVKNLAQQEVDFTSEGSPPPGIARPVDALLAVATTPGRSRRKPALPITVKEAMDRDAAAVHGAGHDAKRHAASGDKPANRQR